MQKLSTGSLLLGIFLTAVLSWGMPVEAGTYKVRTGDCLYRIGLKFDLPYRDLMKANGMDNTRIYSGDVLFIPQQRDSQKKIAIKTTPNPRAVTTKLTKQSVEKTYTAKSSAADKSTFQTVASQKTAAKASIINTSTDRQKYQPKDVEILARIIHAEARGECFEGKVAVGAVILNRLKTPGFPKTLQSIVFQKTRGGVYQFSPVRDGSIRLKPAASAYEAARKAMSGVDPTNGALYFYNPKTARDRWIRRLPVAKKIGNHVFADETAR